MADIILDLRLLGNLREIWQCVTTAAQLDIKGITLSALAGRAAFEKAKLAAEASQAAAGKVYRVRILINPLPPHIDDAELIDDLGFRIRRREHIKAVAQLASSTGMDGIVIDYEDIYIVRKVDKNLAQLVYAQKKPRNHFEIEAADTCDLPSIGEIIAAKAAHVIFDSQLVQRTDTDWCADMLLKELSQSQPKKSRRIVLQTAN